MHSIPVRETSHPVAAGAGPRPLRRTERKQQSAPGRLRSDRAQGPQHRRAAAESPAGAGPAGAAAGLGTGRCGQGRAAAAQSRPHPRAPGAAAAILEGLDEILTVVRLGLPRELRRSLACTNIVENIMGAVRRVCRNVKRWRDASMALRWTAAALLEAAKGFRRLKAKSQLPQLRTALLAHRQTAAATTAIAQAARAA